MSFINTSIKPKLVESKIIGKLIKVQEENKSFNFKISDILYNFLINNLFVICIFIFILFLLIYRYYDVKNKKKRKHIDDDYTVSENNDSYYQTSSDDVDISD